MIQELQTLWSLNKPEGELRSKCWLVWPVNRIKKELISSSRSANVQKNEELLFYFKELWRHPAVQMFLIWQCAWVCCVIDWQCTKKKLLPALIKGTDWLKCYSVQMVLGTWNQFWTGTTLSCQLLTSHTLHRTLAVLSLPFWAIEPPEGEKNNKK